MNQAGRFDIALGQQLVQLLLAEVFGRGVAERILARFPHSCAQIVHDRLERPLARPIADKTCRAAEFGVVGINRDETQMLRSVGEKGGRVFAGWHGLSLVT